MSDSMTVGEFVEHLKTLPQDIPILAEYREWECGRTQYCGCNRGDSSALYRAGPSTKASLFDKDHYASNDGRFFPAVVIVASRLAVNG